MEKLAIGLSLFSLLYIFLFYLLYWYNQLWNNNGEQAVIWSAIKKKTRTTLSKLLRLKKKSERSYEKNIVNN